MATSVCIEISRGLLLRLGARQSAEAIEPIWAGFSRAVQQGHFAKDDEEMSRFFTSQDVMHRHAL
jgi:hypothetical protein